VVIVKGDYTARAAKKYGVDYLIRGIRTTADFDYENLIQQTNVDVIGGAKTLFVMPPRDLGSVSSSFVKALEGPVGWNWTMKKFVPGPAYQAWILDWLRKEWESLWPMTGGRVDDADPAARANAAHWFTHLIGPDAYGGPQRHYHNLDHLVHGLSEIRAWAANTQATREDTDLVKKAFWFHDAVYEHEEGLYSNEEASAQLWLSSQLDAAPAEVAQLIRVTDHFQESQVEHPLKQAMLSVDLAILGQDPEVYQAYARGIRAEYAHLPELEFRQQRGQVLNYLRQKAAREQMFGDAYFADQYSERAVDNLSAEIDKLERIEEPL
jgi:pantetheine-phosphate adenylyltransferase